MGLNRYESCPCHGRYGTLGAWSEAWRMTRMRQSGRIRVGRWGGFLLGVSGLALFCGCPVTPPAAPGDDLDTTEPTDPANPDTSDPDGGGHAPTSPEMPGEDGTAEDDSGQTTDPLTLTDNAYCDAVAIWPADWEEWERQVVELVNLRRSEGAACGASGSFEPAGAMTLSGALTCAASARCASFYQGARSSTRRLRMAVV